MTELRLLLRCGMNCTIDPERPPPGCILASRRGSRQTIGTRGVCGSAIKPSHRWAGRSRINGGRSPGQNRTREILLSGSNDGFENRDQIWQRLAGARAQFRARQRHARFDGRYWNGTLWCHRAQPQSPAQPKRSHAGVATRRLPPRLGKSPVKSIRRCAVLMATAT